jgi:hypothetical protein
LAITAIGLCDDLTAAGFGGSAKTGSSGVSGVLTCTYGYGVENVTLWGTVEGGYPDASSSPTATINSQVVGAMNLQISGPPASSLFAALQTPSQSGATTATSPGGRVSCNKFPNGDVFCQVSSVVGISTPN